MKVSVQKYIASLMLLLFSAFAVGNIFCIHTHNEDNGVIVHSHPFIPSSQHTHTAAQYASIAIINSTNYDDWGCTSFYDFTPRLTSSIILQACNGISIHNRDVATTSLRGPPVLV